MSSIPGGIRANGDGSISFGDYAAKEKIKVNEFEFNGDVYRLKTHAEVTRLEKNGGLYLETVPGAVIHGLLASPAGLSFRAEGAGDTHITINLEPLADYDLSVGGESRGTMNTGSSGKFIFSVSLSGEAAEIAISSNPA